VDVQSDNISDPCIGYVIPSGPVTATNQIQAMRGVQSNRKHQINGIEATLLHPISTPYIDRSVFMLAYILILLYRPMRLDANGEFCEFLFARECAASDLTYH